MDKVNQDGNLLGRVGALILIAAAAIGLARICGLGAGYCLFSSSGRCEAPAVPPKSS